MQIFDRTGIYHWIRANNEPVENIDSNIYWIVSSTRFIRTYTTV